MKRALILAITASIFGPLVALACNICLEDKIAATYDAQVVSAARQNGHQVVFTAVQGKVGPQDSGLARFVRSKIATVPGVDAQTVRVSLAPPAASFALDVKHHSSSEVIAAANRILKPKGLSLQVVRIGAPGAAIKP